MCEKYTTNIHMIGKDSGNYMLKLDHNVSQCFTMRGKLSGFGIDLACVRNSINGGKSKSKKPRSCLVLSPIYFRNTPNIDAG